MAAQRHLGNWTSKIVTTPDFDDFYENSGISLSIYMYISLVCIVHWCINFHCSTFGCWSINHAGYDLSCPLVVDSWIYFFFLDKCIHFKVVVLSLYAHTSYSLALAFCTRADLVAKIYCWLLYISCRITTNSSVSNEIHVYYGVVCFRVMPLYKAKLWVLQS